MTGQNRSKDSGNDGSWFLEAVGAVAPAPTPSETVAALESDNTLPDIPAVPRTADQPSPETDFDGSTGTSTSAFDQPDPISADELDDTRETPLPASDPPLLTDMLTELPPVLRSRRSFRWPALALGIFLLVVIALALVWLPTAIGKDIQLTKQSYADASLALRHQLPDTQQALDVITSPSTPDADVSAAVPAISDLESFAHDLELAATAPLPPRIPVLSDEAVDDLKAESETALVLALRGSDAARQLGYAYVYRTTIPGLLQTGPLPTIADVQAINNLSVSLASTLVEDSSAISDLPTTEATTALNAAALAALTRFASWQDEYLDALAEGRDTAASDLVGELESLRADLRNELGIALGTARQDIDQQIVGLAGDLEGFLDDLTQS